MPFHGAGHFFKASRRISPSSQLEWSLRQWNVILGMPIPSPLPYNVSEWREWLPQPHSEGTGIISSVYTWNLGDHLRILLTTKLFWFLWLRLAQYSTITLIVLVLDFSGNKVRHIFYSQRAYGIAKRRTLQQELLWSIKHNYIIEYAVISVRLCSMG